jgi:hypothetical protein
MTLPEIPKPLSEMTKEERENFMRQKHELERTAKCRNCDRTYLMHKGTSGFCPACVEASKHRCC